MWICFCPTTLIGKVLGRAVSAGVACTLTMTGCAPPPQSHAGRAPVKQMSENKPSSTPASEHSPTRYDRALSVIESSPLGLMLNAYLFAPPGFPKVTSADISRRVYEHGGRSISALSAIHLYVADLNFRHRLGPEQQTRLIVLQTDLFQRQQDFKSYPGEGLTYLSIWGLLLALPLGYPPVRNVLRQLGRALIQKESSWSGKHLWVGSRTYDPVFPIRTFFQVFGPVTLVYFFWFDWKESARGHSLSHAFEQKMDEANFNKVLDDLKTL